MTTAVPGERGRLTVARAAWLFDGTSSALIRDPVVVIEDSTILGVGSGGKAPGHGTRPPGWPQPWPTAACLAVGRSARHPAPLP